MAEVPAVDVSSLPKLAPSDLRLLWVNDRRDGILEAVVEQAGERRLMVLHPDDGVRIGVDQPLRWILFDLSPAQWEEEARWHALFERYVGHHWCFDHSDDDRPSESAESEKSHIYYAEYAQRVPRALDVTMATAWVDELPAH